MFIVYKTTNTHTGDYYFGCHKVDGKNDFYLGSGKALKEQIKQFPIEAFSRETLKEFTTSREALFEEHRLVKSHKSDIHCLNRNAGGGNFEYINSIKGLNNSNSNANKGGRSRALRLLSDPIFAAEESKKISLAFTDSRRLEQSKRLRGNKFALGYKHSEETKEKIGKISSLHQKGNGNSQFGSYWITNGVNNLKWRDEKGSLPCGYHKGRICNSPK